MGIFDRFLYVYCARGMRRKRAVNELKVLGFENAVKIGGINSYHGPVEMNLCF